MDQTDFFVFATCILGSQAATFLGSLCVLGSNGTLSIMLHTVGLTSTGLHFRAAAESFGRARRSTLLYEEASEKLSADLRIEYARYWRRCVALCAALSALETMGFMGTRAFVATQCTMLLHGFAARGLLYVLPKLFTPSETRRKPHWQ